MTEFWAKQWQTQFTQGAVTSTQAMAGAQRAAEAAGHAFYKTTGPNAYIEDFLDEVRELEEAVTQGHSQIHIRNEIGDVIFSLVNICRHHGVDFDEAIHRMTGRWLNRKALQEEKIQSHGYNWRTIPRPLNDQIWKDVKTELKTAEYAD